MAEETIWTGNSSPVRNWGVFLLCLLIIPIPWALWKWLQNKARTFRVTSERLLTTTGVFSKTTDSLELYRVKDIRMTQPFLLRFFGLENIEMTTSDESTPLVVIDFIPQAAKLGDMLRQQVEACRVTKRVREVELE
jgi:uncharacterized membrane protein YdbT with pleckstrin-like domain